MIDALKKVKANPKFKASDNPTPKITIYPEAKHDSWTETYNNPELYKWFLQQKKN
jgi:predicted peptidase